MINNEELQNIYSPKKNDDYVGSEMIKSRIIINAFILCFIILLERIKIKN